MVHALKDEQEKLENHLNAISQQAAESDQKLRDQIVQLQQELFREAGGEDEEGEFSEEEHSEEEHKEDLQNKVSSIQSQFFSNSNLDEDNPEVLVADRTSSPDQKHGAEPDQFKQ